MADTLTSEKRKNVFRRIRDMPAKKRAAAILILLFAAAVITVIVGYFIGNIAYTFRTTLGHTPEHSQLGYAFRTQLGLIVTFGVSGLIIFLVFALATKVSYGGRIISRDKNNVDYLDKRTFGSAAWMTEKEAKEFFDICDVTETNQTIYAKLHKDGTEVVAWKDVSGIADQNNLIIGTIGSGKSWCFVRTELINTIERGDSFVCTDPSAELVTTLGKFCQDRGYDTKVLNLANLDYSDFWNCMEETIDPETGRLDTARLQTFVNVLMQNLSDGDTAKFWNQTSTNLISIAAGYCSFMREKDIIDKYRTLYVRVSESDDKIPGRSEIVKEMTAENENMVSYKWCCDQIRSAAAINGYDSDEIEHVLSEITATAKSYTIIDVFNVLNDFTNLDAGENFNAMPNWHPGHIAYNIYQATGQNETVKSSAILSVLLNMSIFSEKKLMKIMNHDGIHVKDINLRKCAYFVVMSDKSTATKAVASLFFSFFFSDAMSNWDEENTRTRGDTSKNKCLPVTVMLDEFYSIGVIGGSPDMFTTVMSNSRKRWLHTSIIVQTYPQIAARYGQENAGTIQGCCSTIIFLGCNDPETAEFISKFCGGQATVAVETNTIQSDYTAGLKLNSDIKAAPGSRYVITPDEARRYLGKIMIIKRGAQPLDAYRFPYTDTPAFKNHEIEPISYMDLVQKTYEADRALRQEIIYKYKSVNASDAKTYIAELTDRLMPRTSESDIEFDFGNDSSDDNGNVIDLSAYADNSDVIDVEAKPSSKEQNSTAQQKSESKKEQPVEENKKNSADSSGNKQKPDEVQDAKKQVRTNPHSPHTDEEKNAIREMHAGKAKSTSERNARLRSRLQNK